MYRFRRNLILSDEEIRWGVGGICLGGSRCSLAMRGGEFQPQGEFRIRDSGGSTLGRNSVRELDSEGELSTRGERE